MIRVYLILCFTLSPPIAGPPASASGLLQTACEHNEPKLQLTTTVASATSSKVSRAATQPELNL
jgi:hypothetical protein